MKITASFPGASLGQWYGGENILYIETKIEKESNLRSPRFTFLVENYYGESLILVVKKVQEIIYPKFPSKTGLFLSLDGEKWSPVVVLSRKENNASEYEFKFKPGADRFFISSYPLFRKKDMDIVIKTIREKHQDTIKVDYQESGVYLKILPVKSSLKKILLVCGQHPGESITYFFALGFLRAVDRFLENGNNLDVEIHIIPYIDFNSYLEGGHRFSQGYDLNRTWHDPRSYFQRIVIDLACKDQDLVIFDIHGDEMSAKSYVQEYSNIKNTEPMFLLNFVHIKQRSGLLKMVKKILLGVKTKNYGLTLTGWGKKNKNFSVLVELSMSSLVPADAEVAGGLFLKEIL